MLESAASDLEAKLRIVLELLDEAGERHWSGRIRKVLSGPTPGRQAPQILGWYGGMGSFNDDARINRALDGAISDLYAEAQSCVRQDAAGGGPLTQKDH
jgi:hypothetical protein